MVKSVHTPKVKTVLFEGNGVLLDMQPLAAQDQHVARAEFGLEVSTERIRTLWRQQLAKNFYPALFNGGRGADGMTWQQMRDIFRSYDDADPAFKGRLLPDASTTLNRLKHLDVLAGLVTVTPSNIVEKRLQEGGLSLDRFDLVHAGAETDVSAGRPVLEWAIGELAARDIAPHEVVFVGAQPSAASEAAAVDAQYAVVSTGAYTHEELLAAGVPPERLLQSLGQLPGMFGIEAGTPGS